jgi:hypothetical protein
VTLLKFNKEMQGMQLLADVASIAELFSALSLVH